MRPQGITKQPLFDALILFEKPANNSLYAPYLAGLVTAFYQERQWLVHKLPSTSDLGGNRRTLQRLFEQQVQSYAEVQSE
jgi:hypothetical protein